MNKHEKLTKSFRFKSENRQTGNVIKITFYDDGDPETQALAISHNRDAIEIDLQDLPQLVLLLSSISLQFRRKSCGYFRKVALKAMIKISTILLSLTD